MLRVRRVVALFTVMIAFAPPIAASDIDYGSSDAWLARPEIESAASLTPADSDYRNMQAIARADVFYLHPTTGMKSATDNVPVDDPQARATAHVMLMTQATPFNGVARVYAPHYRQAALHVFDGNETALQGPMNRAYEDIRRAFAYYAEHDNHDRPFFLVGHSQGSNHGLRLLIEEISGTPLADRLVAAYLPGMPTPRAPFDTHLATIAPCTTPMQTGCVAAWGVFAEGYRDFGDWEAVNHFWDANVGRWRSARGMSLVSVNPVNWREDDAPTLPAAHLGAVPFGVTQSHFSRVMPHLVGARTVNGYTLVSPTPLPADLFYDGGVFDEGNYHVFDIALFWADLRANARNRFVAFLAAQGQAAGPLIIAPAAVTAIAGRPFRLTLGLRNGPAAFNAEGLPAGLSLESDTGEISGSPRTMGRHVVTLTAIAQTATDIAELVLLIEADSHHQRD